MSELSGLPLAASDEAQKVATIFDFDTDSCYPAPAVSPTGEMNQGLEATGNITGGCRGLTQFQNANTYSRTISIDKGGSTYSVHMYALYFQKDQAIPGISTGGHRHDWEYALVWLKDGVLTHASCSAHGGVTTKSKEELSFDADKPDHVKVVYHKDGVRTHCFRFAKANEAPENDLHQWYTPPVVEWDRMQGTSVSNEQLRVQFNTFAYGDANCSFNDKNFPNEIAKGPPMGYPSGDEWKQAAIQTILVAPPTPNGLVARWFVFPDRNADRDDRAVNLLKGQRARIVVYLPEPARSQFHCTLKHDKHNADDRARTDRIGNGAEVSGDAQDWPSFGNRIYLGDRDGTDQSGLLAAPYGFYVDLVLV